MAASAASVRRNFIDLRLVDDFTSQPTAVHQMRHRARMPSANAFLVEHDLLRKPVSTFRDHALRAGLERRYVAAAPQRATECARAGGRRGIFTFD
jgi:hypothetical protein